ncbi:MAG: hypothetical protein KGI38_03095 [Thaumarchaeota archaeon]|nr:hypothetical protein [Nitrososphaerota archaeon]
MEFLTAVEVETRSQLVAKTGAEPLSLRTTYPAFIFFPRSSPPPSWVVSLTRAFADLRVRIDTEAGNRNESDTVLQLLRPSLEHQGFAVESPSKEIPRPVLFGEGGRMEKEYRIDAYNPAVRLALEVEAGRGAKSNAIYRDLVHMSLIVDADYASIAVPLAYRFKSGAKEAIEPAYKK